MSRQYIAGFGVPSKRYIAYTAMVAALLLCCGAISASMELPWISFANGVFAGGAFWIALGDLRARQILLAFERATA